MFERLKRYLFRLRAIDLLRLLTKRRGMTYEEISSRTGIPISALSKYLNGKSIPSYERALKILEFAERHGLIVEELSSRLVISNDGFVRLSNVACDVVLARALSMKIFKDYETSEFNKIFAVDLDSSCLAFATAEIFLSDAVLIGDPSSRISRRRLMVSSRIGRGDSILVVGYAMSNPELVLALRDIADERGARIAAYSAVLLGDRFRELEDSIDLGFLIRI